MRSALRRAAEAAKTEIEFKPCQNVVDFRLPQKHKRHETIIVCLLCFLWPELLSSPACRCTQPANLLFQFIDLFLLLLDRVEHGPDDWITFDHQVTVAVRGYGFGNNLLHRLCGEADVFTFRLDAQGIVRLVFVSAVAATASLL